jgi:hypothetical protein
MAVILGEAMAEGYFPGYDLDHVVSLTNLVMQPFCNPFVMMDMIRTATPDNLRIVVNTLFDGLGAAQAIQDAENVTPLRAIS